MKTTQEKYNNFLISGFGRSGTKFLSSIMNKSVTWVVNHEPRGAYEEMLYKKGLPIDDKVVNNFKNNNYGEVNSRMRFYFNDIDVEKKGIIIRDPKEIITSICNRNKTEVEITRIIDELNVFWHKFHEWIELGGVLKIDFNSMTNDADYLKNVLTHFGISDVEINEEIFKNKINKNNNVKYKLFEDLPNKFKDNFNKLDWD